VGEPTALGIETIHAGIRRIRVTIKGMAAHVAYRENAAGVIEAAARFLTGLPELEGENGEAPLPRLNVGSIRAGIGDTFQSWRPSILPDSCTLLLDVRTAPDQNPDKVLKQLQAILESIRAEDQRFRMKAEWLEPPDHYPRPAYRTDERAELARTVERVHVEVCGNKPRVGDLGKVKYFGSDAPYFQAASMSTVVYGPGQPELMNAPDERIKVDDLVLGAKVYAGLALEICGLVR
jgi:acetylornithine deacetylase/succinyl-diaminopimelate desuccinylase-like protein